MCGDSSGSSNGSSWSQVQQLVSSPSRHKLLILAAQFLEDGGGLVLQKGCFSPNHLLHILEEEEVRRWRCSSDLLDSKHPDV